MLGGSHEEKNLEMYFDEFGSSGVFFLDSDVG
jgi:hypothetical protein